MEEDDDVMPDFQKLNVAPDVIEKYLQLESKRSH